MESLVCHRNNKCHSHFTIDWHKRAFWRKNLTFTSKWTLERLKSISGWIFSTEWFSPFSQYFFRFTLNSIESIIISAHFAARSTLKMLTIHKNLFEMGDNGWNFRRISIFFRLFCEHSMMKFFQQQFYATFVMPSIELTTKIVMHVMRWPSLLTEIIYLSLCLLENLFNVNHLLTCIYLPKYLWMKRFINLFSFDADEMRRQNACVLF